MHTGQCSLRIIVRTCLLGLYREYTKHYSSIKARPYACSNMLVSWLLSVSKQHYDVNIGNLIVAKLAVYSSHRFCG